MLKTLSTDGSRIASFPGSSRQGMASSQYSDDICVPNFLFPPQMDPPRLVPLNTGLNLSFPPQLSQTHGLGHLERRHSQSPHGIAATSSLVPNTLVSSDTTSPSNLFQAGFQDCATEVIQFLKDQEKMDSANPLLQGLRSHLVDVCQTMSETDSLDIDHKDSPVSCGQSFPLMTSSPVSTKSSISRRGLSIIYSPENYRDRVKSSKRKRSSDSGLFVSPSCSSLSPEEDTLLPVQAKRSCYLNSISEDQNQIPSLSYLANKAILDPLLTKGKDCASPIPVPKSKFPQFQSDTQNTVISPMSVTRTIDNAVFSYHPLESISASTEFGSHRVIPVQLSNHDLEENISSLLPSVSSSLFSSSASHISPTPLTGSHVSDISSLTADNVDDVLLSVESCQSHEDPRVRQLASKILDLIHDIDEDNEDDEYVDDDSDCEESRQELEDSGIDLDEE